MISKNRASTTGTDYPTSRILPSGLPGQTAPAGLSFGSNRPRSIGRSLRPRPVLGHGRGAVLLITLLAILCTGCHVHLHVGERHHYGEQDKQTTATEQEAEHTIEEAFSVDPTS